MLTGHRFAAESARLPSWLVSLLLRQALLAMPQAITAKLQAGQLVAWLRLALSQHYVGAVRDDQKEAIGIAAGLALRHAAGMQ